MPKFTTIPNLLVDARQSLQDSSVNNQIVELGTRTLDNRDYWENNNFNESTLKPYLTDNRETLDSKVVNDIVYANSIGRFNRFQYSIDALPFVTDPNNQNEIIRLDNYYDKINNSNEYNLATEGKINFYIYTRESGRPTPDGNINNYEYRPIVNKFDSYANTEGDTGFYLFKLNWGDGTKIEYTDEPKLLESTVLLNHTYKKPGFYTISGVVYAMYSPEDEKSIGGWERFETKILLNPSQNYELSLYGYDNFATIGGISSESVLVKSAVNLVGINPINFDDSRATPDSIEAINLLDRLEIFNFINKVSESALDKFNDFLLPFTEEFQQQQREANRIYGCTNSNAENYNESANTDDESCIFDVNVIFNTPQGSNILLYGDGGLSQSDLLWDYTIPNEYFQHEDVVYNPTSFNSYRLDGVNSYSINSILENNIIIANITNIDNAAFIEMGFELLPINVTRRLSKIWEQDYESGWFILTYNGEFPSEDFYDILEVDIFIEGEASGTDNRDDNDSESNLSDAPVLTLNNVGGSSNNFANIVTTYDTSQSSINGQYYEGSVHTIKISFSENHYLEALTSPTHPGLNFNFVESGQPSFEFRYEKWSFFMPSGIEPKPGPPPVEFNPNQGNFAQGVLSPQGQWGWDATAWVAVESNLTIHAQVSTAVNPTIYDGRIGIELVSNNDDYGLPAPIEDSTEFTLDSNNNNVQLNATPEVDTNDWDYDFDKWVIPNSKSNYIHFGNNELESQNRTPIIYWKSSALNFPRTIGTITAYFFRTGATSGNTGGGNAGGGKAPGDDDVELPGDNEVDQYGGGVS